MNVQAAALDNGLVRAQDPDAEFIARLADSSTLAFRVAYSVLRNNEDAEDVAQEVFTRAHSRFAQLRDLDRFRGWLVRMTWRLALDVRRSARRRERRELDSPLPVAPSVEDVVARQERADRLWRAIDALDEPHRLVIILAAIEEQDLASVGRLLDIPEGTVKSRLHTARSRIREMLA